MFLDASKMAPLIMTSVLDLIAFAQTKMETEELEVLHYSL